jgi:RNA polymerase sigma factor (sigma-70 family)
MANELRDSLREALAELPEDHREVLRLLQDEGLTFEVAAARMGRSVGAVKKLHGRVLARLADRLGVDGRKR